MIYLPIGVEMLEEYVNCCDEPQNVDNSLFKKSNFVS
jgi:hypothetical protein